MWLRTYSSTGLDGRILIRSAVSSGILPRSHERTRASLRLSMSISRPSARLPRGPSLRQTARVGEGADPASPRPLAAAPPGPAFARARQSPDTPPASVRPSTRPLPLASASPAVHQPAVPREPPDRRQIAHRPILPPPTAAARIPGCKSALARLPSDSGLPARSGPPRRTRRAIGRAGPSPRRTYADVHVYRRGRAGRGREREREREPHIPVVRNSDRGDEDAAVLPARTSPHATPARARRANDPARR